MFRRISFGGQFMEAGFAIEPRRMATSFRQGHPPTPWSTSAAGLATKLGNYSPRAIETTAYLKNGPPRHSGSRSAAPNATRHFRRWRMATSFRQGHPPTPWSTPEPASADRDFARHCLPRLFQAQRQNAVFEVGDDLLL